MKIKNLHILVGVILLATLFACKNEKKNEPQGVKIESISFRQGNYSVSVTETAGINLRKELKITPVSIADTCKIKWELSDPSVAVINDKENIIPEKEGETTITATVQGKSTQCKYTVKAVHVKSVTIDPAGYADDVNVGSTKKLSVIIDPEDATYSGISWKSSNTAVATVSQDGTVTCRGGGDCIITATVDGKEGKCNVTYSKNIVHVTSVTVTPANYTADVEVGATKKLTATVKPDNATDKTVTWKSSNTAVATVSQDGTVTCKGIGTCDITATADRKTGSCTVTYNKIRVTSVEVNPQIYETDVKIGATWMLTATVKPDNATDKTVTWKSNNPAVATVSQDGIITCRGVGSAAIVAYADGKSGSCSVTYNKIPVTSVKISRPGIAFNAKGQTYKLTAEVLPSDATYPDVTWTSSNKSVATVDYNGLVTCTGFGVATISAKADGKSDGCLVMSNQSYVIDICGNAYTSVQIGTQVWMAQNMRCDKYDTKSERKGESAFYVNASDKNKWEKPYSGISDQQINLLGYIYSWYAAVGLGNGVPYNPKEYDSNKRQGICPNGWHVPTDAEWKTLENFLGSSTAGKKLKTTTGWVSGNGTDSYSFAALPAGYGFDIVEGVGSFATFWTATPSDGRDDSAKSRILGYNDDKIDTGKYQDMEVRLSVRCIKN